MFQIFNFNFEKLNTKKNSTKFLIIGYILVGLGIFSFIYKGLGIKLVSWTLAIALLFIAYLNLTSINELKRYAPKGEIAPYTRNQFIILISVVLLFLFPEKIQSIVSLLAGGYIIVSQLLKIINSKNNPYYRFGFESIIIIIIGFTLVLSPLFLSRFIVSILAFIIVLIGISLVNTGNKLKNL
ncbi:MAG: hypothetical protein RRZ84_08200 [Romboutsia sp.]